MPGKNGKLKIPTYAKVLAYDEEMNPFELEGTELLARAICHELDHLEGQLYVERVEGPLVNTEDLEEQQ